MQWIRGGLSAGLDVDNHALAGVRAASFRLARYRMFYRIHQRADASLHHDDVLTFHKLAMTTVEHEPRYECWRCQRLLNAARPTITSPHRRP